MAVSAERLASVDEELASLGRSEDQIESVLLRFEDREPEQLERVDAELEALAEGLGALPVPEPAPAEAQQRVEEEDEEEEATIEAQPAARLSVDDLFDDTTPLSDEPDLSSIMGAAPIDDESPFGETGLADSLEAELEGFVPPVGEEPSADPTGVFSAYDIEAIERDAKATSQAPAARPETVPPPIRSSRPVRPPSDHPPARDPAFDALLGDDEAIFRPSQHPPAAEEAGDFELLIDEEDLLLVDEEEEEALAASGSAPAPWPAPSQPPPRPLSEIPPPSQAPPATQSNPPPTDESSGPKKGFFKKLFGGGE